MEGSMNTFALQWYRQMQSGQLDRTQLAAAYPNIKRSPGGASNDLVPNLQTPENPVPMLQGQPEVHVVGGGG
jgi:arylsulfatase